METIVIALAPLLLAAQTLAAGMPAHPHAEQAAIVTALDRYAELSPRLPSVTLAKPNEFEGTTKIPAWLADIHLTQQEAAALIAVTSAYRSGPVVSGTGPAQTYTRRKRNVLEYVAGAAVSAATADAARKSGADGPMPLGLRDGPRSVTLGGAPTYYGNSTLYTALLRQMGTCTGALTSALQKLAIEHANTRFVTELQMLTLENKTLQSPADAVCTRGL